MAHCHSDSSHRLSSSVRFFRDVRDSVRTCHIKKKISFQSEQKQSSKKKRALKFYAEWFIWLWNTDLKSSWGSSLRSERCWMFPSVFGVFVSISVSKSSAEEVECEICRTNWDETQRFLPKVLKHHENVKNLESDWILSWEFPVPTSRERSHNVRQIVLTSSNDVSGFSYNVERAFYGHLSFQTMFQWRPLSETFRERCQEHRHKSMRTVEERPQINIQKMLPRCY